MSRRDTILISVFINAGLLVILFVAAIFLRTGPENAQQNFAAVAPAEVMVASEEQEMQSEETFLKLEEDKKEVVHKLPSIEPQEPALLPAAEIATVSKNAYIEIVAKKGDSLDKLAKKHQTTVAVLQKFNNLKSTLLKVNQKLKVPVADAAKKPLATVEQSLDASCYYIVKCGDNPWTIAMKHHLKTEELLKLNNLNDERARKLRPGDRLRIR